jgi:circadian clock protein KaiB
MSNSVQGKNSWIDSIDISQDELDLLINPKLEKYVFRLYVANNSPTSMRAVHQINQLCEQHLSGRYELEVINIYENPNLLEEDQIFAVPTLIKKLPLPLHKLIGDLTDTEKIITCLDL